MGLAATEANASDTWEGKMRGTNRPPSGLDLSQEVLPGSASTRSITVDVHCHVRGAQLNGVAVHGVTPEQQLFPFIANEIATVTRSVAVEIDCDHTPACPHDKAILACLSRSQLTQLSSIVNGDTGGFSNRLLGRSSPSVDHKIRSAVLSDATAQAQRELETAVGLVCVMWFWLAEKHRLVLKSVLAHCPELGALTRHVRSFADMLVHRRGECFRSGSSTSSPTTCLGCTTSPPDSSATWPR
ncbi:hypothetical protein ACFFS4_33740 [Kutzneria kofuensis]|uniref:Uncharacterized protein n=1 Tax=Kutzneria kofuensis TaxID=103725 RepID=A0A7W9NEP8_9PSEU|nr:hypothetical protein [Kutzneria kofuensis]MBB5889895.1 hypothetical protein [Kutzneria kofuensis]